MEQQNDTTRPWIADKPLSEQVLEARGQIDHAEIYLEQADPTLLQDPAALDAVFADPFDLKDMDRAAECLHEALEKSVRIMVHGDYDTDGVTAAALLCEYLRADGRSEILHYIPERLEEGYGLSEGGIRAAIEEKVDLLVTVDCGSSSLDEVDALKKAGIRVIVTDHHRCADAFPQADAFVNPSRPDDPGMIPDLSGAGVALELCRAVDRLKGGADWIRALDLAALGTVGDLMLLTGENRRIVQYGLLITQTMPRPGLEAILRQLNIDPADTNARSLGFSISPRINACGRMASAEPAFQLLMNSDRESAMEQAQLIEDYNGKRREEENRVLNAVLRHFSEHPEYLNSKILLAAGNDWHPGVIGIVASRVVEVFHRPAIIATLDPRTGTYRASGRAVGQTDLLAILKKAGAYLTQCGGHRAAAGLEFAADQLDSLRECLRIEADGLEIEDFYQLPQDQIDLRIPAEALTLENAQDLQRLEPFGRGNPEPRFLLEVPGLVECRAVGQDQAHLRVGVRANSESGVDRTVYGIFFKAGEREKELSDAIRLRIELFLRVNHFRGREKPEILVEAIENLSATYPVNNQLRESGEDEVWTASCFDVEAAQSLFDLHECFPRLSAARLAAPFAIEPEYLIPDEALIREVYLRIRNSMEKSGSDILILSLSELLDIVPVDSEDLEPLKLFRIAISLDMYAEAGVFRKLLWRRGDSVRERSYCLIRENKPPVCRISETLSYRRLISDWQNT